MNNKKSILMLIVSILSFLITLLAVIFFIRIIQNKNIHTRTVLATLESRMIEKENFSALEDKIKEIQVTRDKIDSFIIKKNQADLFVDYLENLGTSSNTKLTVENVDIPTSTPNTIIFKVSISGDFNDVMKTISILENAPYSISINSVYINKEIIQTKTISDVDPKIKTPQVLNTTPSWVANVNFGILSN